MNFLNVIRVITVRLRQIVFLCCLSHPVLTLVWQQIHHRKYLPKGLNFQIHRCSLEKLIFSTTLLKMNSFSGAKYLRLELMENFIIPGPQLTKPYNWRRCNWIYFIKWVNFPRKHSVSIYCMSC